MKYPHNKKKEEKETPMRYLLMFTARDNPNTFYAMEGFRRAYLSRQAALEQAKRVAGAKPDWIVYVVEVVNSVQVHADPLEINTFRSE